MTSDQVIDDTSALRVRNTGGARTYAETGVLHNATERCKKGYTW